MKPEGQEPAGKLFELGELGVGRLLMNVLDFRIWALEETLVGSPGSFSRLLSPLLPAPESFSLLSSFPSRRPPPPTVIQVGLL